jgi:hypothetical protein
MRPNGLQHFKDVVAIAENEYNDIKYWGNHDPRGQRRNGYGGYRSRQPSLKPFNRFRPKAIQIDNKQLDAE